MAQVHAKKRFTIFVKYVIHITYMQLPVTTRQAAKAVGISLMTVQRWIAQKRVEAPAVNIVNGRATRLWQAEDINRLRQTKREIYCKGRGRKKGSKVSAHNTE